MSLTLETKDFTLLLAAAKLTAYAKPNEDEVLSGIYLYTTEGEVGEDVGVGTLLVAIGYDGATVGQFAVGVSGTLEAPILIPSPNVGWMTQMCNTTSGIAKRMDKESEHTVELTVSGSSLLVKTLTDGFPAEYDTDGRSPLLDTSQYPAREAAKRLNTKGIEDGIPSDADSLVRVFGVQSLKIMQNAAKTLKTPIRVFPSAVNGGPAILTDGTRWRAVTSVEPYEGGTSGVPDIDPIDVALPRSASDAKVANPANPTDDADDE